ncbi:MAG: hypothetical protein ACRYF0_06475 [Janthinobacterium lividum]
MATKANGPSPDNGRKLRRGTLAAAWQLGIGPKLRCCWQQTLVMAAVSSVEMARASEIRQLRAQLKRAEYTLDILRKASVIFRQSTQ